MKRVATKRLRSAAACAVFIAGFAMAPAQTTASELVYHPYNPSFGGNPLNGPVLLNSAIATRKHKAPDIDSDRYGIEERSPLDQLNETLERLIVTRMASAASFAILDDKGDFIPGSLETENFIITVTDIGGGQLTVTTYDKATGGTTTVEVNKL